MTDPASLAAAAAANVIPQDEEEQFDSATSDVRPLVLNELRRLLHLSKTECTAIADFFATLGFSSTQLEDLMLLEEKDFDTTTVAAAAELSTAMKRKLLLVAEFLRLGGSLDEVNSMPKLVQLVYAARRNAASISIQSIQNDPVQRDATSLDEVVNLNVGGYKFTTTRKTLCRIPGSALEAMFSGRHENATHSNKDGEYIIDRNGSHFQYILDFVRMGSVVTLPSEQAAKEELAVEADFYGLDALVRAILRPKIDTNDYLPDEVLAIRAQEEKLREAFRTHSAEGYDLHCGLVSLFCPDHGVESLPLTYDPLDESEGLACVMDVRKRAPTGTPVTVKTLEKFRTNFNRRHANVLNRLEDILEQEPVIIAGGSVLRALTSGEGIRTSTFYEGGSDVDIFLHTRDPEEANRIARQIFFALAVDHERWVIVRSRGVINIHRWAGHRWNFYLDQKIQIILRLYDSPAEVLYGFDCDSCCCAYDGKAVWVSPRCLYALRRGINIVNSLHSWPNKASYELRLTKYAHRGFAVIIPGLDKKRIQYDNILSKDLKDLKGLARLLKAAFVLEADLPQMHAWGWAGVPTLPRRIVYLRDHILRDFDDAMKLLQGLGGYDEMGVAVFVPSVYIQGETPAGMYWYESVGGSVTDFPEAIETRALAWAEIVNAPQHSAVEEVPDRLVDAWDTEKRSREYLNANTETYDRDNLYYDHAYEVDE